MAFASWRKRSTGHRPKCACTRRCSTTSGAESIDFLDILFRVEAAFGIKIAEADMWKGSIGGTDPESIRARGRATARRDARVPLGAVSPRA